MEPWRSDTPLQTMFENVNQVLSLRAGRYIIGTKRITNGLEQQPTQVHRFFPTWPGGIDLLLMVRILCVYYIRTTQQNQ